MNLKFKEPEPISRQQVEHALTSANSKIAAEALIRMALWERDWAWAEKKCLAALHDQRKEVKAAALTAFGHLARLHRVLHLELVVPAIRELLSDPDYGGIAQDALDDIGMFIR